MLITTILPLILLSGCKQQHSCDLQMTSVTAGERAPITITKELGNCEFEFEAFFSLRDGEVSAHGKLLSDDNAFFLHSDKLGEQPIRFFDFDTKKMEQYVIKINGQHRASFFVITKDDILSHAEYGEVHLFRIRDGWIFHEPDKVAMDVVFFASRTRGIVGSYLSMVEAGRESIANVSGDILTQLRDYSRARFVVIE